MGIERPEEDLFYERFRVGCRHHVLSAPAMGDVGKDPVPEFVMIFPVVNRVFERDIGSTDKFWMIRGFCVQDTGTVMLDKRLDLLTGTGVDDRIIRVLCEPFYDRIVGDIKGGDEKEGDMLLPVQVPEQPFLERNLDLKFLQVGRGRHHFAECDMILASTRIRSNSARS